MKHPKTELYFLLTLLVGVVILTFFIFKPFLIVLILAVVFATVFGPVHKRVLILTRGSAAGAALLTTMFVLVIVIVPVTVLSVQIFQESTQLYTALVENGGASDFLLNISDTLRSLTRFSPVPIPFPDTVNEYVTQGLGWLLGHLGPLFASFARLLLGIFIFLLALYYLFKDGHKLKKAIIAYSPLQDVHDETIFNRLAIAINSVIKGSLAMALMQGVLTAIGFALFGVPNPTLWGSVATVAALIPGVGTALVIVPAVLFLYWSGDSVLATGLLIWGVTAVGLVDNFVGPKLVERGVRLHSFLILLSIFGGLSFFGPFGFLLGPLILSLLFALLEIYSAISKEHQRI